MPKPEKQAKSVQAKKAKKAKAKTTEGVTAKLSKIFFRKG